MVHKITSSLSGVFTPEFGGNQNFPESEQIKVRYKTVTPRLKDELVPRIMNLVQDEKDSSKMVPTMTVEIKREKYLETLVLGIDNLAYLDKDEKETPIKTVKALFSAPNDFDPLIEEIYTFLTGLVNNEVPVKN